MRGVESRDAPRAECDLWRRVELLDEVARGQTSRARVLGLEGVDVGAARRIQKVRDQLLSSVRRQSEEVLFTSLYAPRMSRRGFDMR